MCGSSSRKAVIGASVIPTAGVGVARARARHAMRALCAGGFWLTSVLGVPVALAVDNTPQNMISFFMQVGCPAGWSVATEAQGRLLLGVASGDSTEIGKTVGDPLTDQEDREHSHDYETTVHFSKKDIEGDNSCCNTQGAGDGDKNVPKSQPGTTASASSNTPLIQLTVCKRTSPPDQAGAQDPYPQGAVSFFHQNTCPGEANGIWATNKIGDGSLGYFLVPFFDPPPATVGQTSGQGLKLGEDRTHTHDFSSSVTPASVEYIGKSGCVSWLGLCTHLSSSSKKDFNGTSETSSTALPYVQLKLCKKQVYTRNTNPPANVPGNVVTFFTTVQCPTGWKMTQTSTGRYLVGLPQGGIAGASFGGNPLKPTDTTPLPWAGHSHDFSGTVDAGSHHVALGSGAGASGYAKAGNVNYDGTTDIHSSNLPYLAVIQCQPCAQNDADQSCQASAQ